METKKVSGELRQFISVALTLHTQISFSLFKGKQRGAVGLFKFAGLIRRLCHASKAGDPYADQFLLRIYDALIRVRRSLKESIAEYAPLLLQENNVSIALLTDTAPRTFTLSFMAPYGFLATYLLADFDYLMRLLITLRCTALLSETEIQTLIRQKALVVRQAFSKPLQWCATGVTREAILQNLESAQIAKTKMGEIHQDVLSGVIELPVMPHHKGAKVVGSNDSKIRSKATESL